MKVKDLLTSKELSQRTGYPVPSRLTEWRKAGKGPDFIMIEGRVFYRLSDIEDYERRNTVKLSAKRMKKKEHHRKTAIERPVTGDLFGGS
jgi:hypothetical protein